MGNILKSFSLDKVFGRILSGNKRYKILLLGLDAAGKTTILYKLKLAEFISTIPTIGFNVETVQYKNINMTIWDVGGQNTIRKLWRYYYNDADAVIFVIDSADRDRIAEAEDELKKMADEDRLRDAKFLIFANKQDLPKALNGSALIEGLKLKTMQQQWYIQPCCAANGEGIFEGLDWLNNVL